MRVNVYSQELTSEVKMIMKLSNTGKGYHAAQLILHSSDKLHNTPDDDDRSAITFWLPSSNERRESIATAFDEISNIFRSGDKEAMDVPNGATHLYKGQYFEWEEADLHHGATVSVWMFDEWNLIELNDTDILKMDAL